MLSIIEHQFRMIFILVLILVATLVYFRLVKPLDYWQKRGVKQQNRLKAFLFNWFGLFRKESVTTYVQRMYDQFPNAKYSGIYQFNDPVLVIKDPELMKLISIKEFDHFTDRRVYIPEDVDALWGGNLFSLRGAEWRNMRTTLSPAFTGSKMKAMFDLMRDCAENFTNHFLKKDQDVISLELKDAFSRFCNDVIATTAFGLEVDSLTNQENEFFKMGTKATDIYSFSKSLKFIGYLISPTLYKLLGLKFIDNDVKEFFTNVIDQTIEMREKKGIVRPDMIHLLMEARSGVIKKEESGVTDTEYTTEGDSPGGKFLSDITNEEITAQALVFFFAGFESVSSMLSFMAHELAANQDVQEKLRKEILDTSMRKPTFDTLAKLKYMDMVISEVLRMYPTQVINERTCTESFTIQPESPGEKPFRIEKGVYVIFPSFAIQRDPTNFPNPDRFDPERFNNENKGKIVPQTYQPFGHGPRKCIGARLALLETKVLFFYLLSNFEIVPVEKTKIPLVMSKNILAMTSEGGFWLGLKRLVK